METKKVERYPAMENQLLAENDVRIRHEKYKAKNPHERVWFCETASERELPFTNVGLRIRPSYKL